MHRLRFIFFVALLFVPSAAWPQGDPRGPEFRVNTYTSGNQGGSYSTDHPVAVDPSGNFVVVWGSHGQVGSNGEIFGQRYHSSGTPLGPEFRVSTVTSFHQSGPSVAADSSGNFVVVWEGDEGSYYSGLGVFGQRYDNSGAPLGPEFRVNTYTTGLQGGTSVAADSSGNFVVVWWSVQGSFSVFGQRYDNSGTPLGPEFRVNTYTPFPQFLPAVSSDASGNFVVVWNSDTQDGSAYGVFGQRYDSSGTPLGPEFRVNTYTSSFQYFPSVAADSSGNFVVVWSSFAQDGSASGVFGQRYASSGAPVGPEFRVNTFTAGYQYAPAVALDSSGNFVVAWQSNGQDGSGYGVFGQRYDSSGTPLGQEFRVNTYTTSNEGYPSVAADSMMGSGNFVVVWRSDTQDGSGFGVFGQRYGRIVPVELIHFRVE